jgi:hypothetical protein
LKLLIQHGDLLNGGFLGRNASHLKFQPSDILTRPGGDNGFGQFEIILPRKYVSEDVRSVEWDPFWCAMAIGGVEVDANDASAFVSEGFTTERASGGETRGSLGNDLFATA